MTTFDHPCHMSREAREAIGLTDEVDRALSGLTAAKIDAGPGSCEREVGIRYLAKYLRRHAFDAGEVIDLVWEAAGIVDKRRSPAPDGPPGGETP